MQYRRRFRLSARNAKDVARDLDQEIEAHLAMRIEDLEREGHSPARARELALERFGNRDELHESVRTRDQTLRRRQLMDELRLDVTLAGRRAQRAPGATILSLTTFALGIGLTTTMFTFVDRVLLRPLPYPEPQQLVVLQGADSMKNPIEVVSPSNWMDWVEASRSLEASAIHRDTRLAISAGATPRRVDGEIVTRDFFSVLKTPMLVGRGFVEEDATNGAAVVSEDVWRTELGSGAQRMLIVEGKAIPVVGVVRSGDEYPESNHVWRLTTFTTRGTGLVRNNINFSAIARLAPNTTRETAQQELSIVAANIQANDPLSAYSHAVFVRGLQEQLVTSTRVYLGTLLGGVGLVLLIACANLAALNLARGIRRSGEVSVRYALGASRARVVRQLMTEQMLLAMVGGALGVLLAWWGTGILARIVSTYMPRINEVQMDGRIVLFALAMTAAAGGLAGALPALRTSRFNAGGRGFVGGGRGLPGRMLVIVEVALAAILLVGGGLLLRSFNQITNRDIGFDANGVATAEVVLNETRYPDDASRTRFWNALFERAASEPGVAAVAVANWIPTGNGGTAYLEVEGIGQDPDGASYRAVSGEYFRALGIDMQRGRTFTSTDGPNTPRVVIVNRRLADRYWPNSDPIGRRIRTPGMEGYGDQVQWQTIIGVVDDIRHDGHEDDVSQQVYVLQSQVPNWSRALHVVARAADGSDVAAAAAVTRVIHDIDAQIAVDTRSLERDVAGMLTERRLATGLMTTFGILAVILAAVGVYGLLSFSVAERTREIGVRAALGADQSRIVRMVLRNAAAIVLLGGALGLLAAFWMTRVLRGLLVDVTNTDPVTYLVTALLIVAIALTAAILPARRAAKIDPLTALHTG